MAVTSDPTQILAGFQKKMLRLKKASTLTARAGWTEKATYPDGKEVAPVARLQEYGGMSKIKAYKVSVYRKLLPDGKTYANKGQFVKKRYANVETIHEVPERTIYVPARPFMRPAQAQNAHEWKESLKKLLKSSTPVETAFEALSEDMAADIRQAINEVEEPALSPMTIRMRNYRRKKLGQKPLKGEMLTKPLEDTGVMSSTCVGRVTKGEGL